MGTERGAIFGNVAGGILGRAVMRRSGWVPLVSLSMTALVVAAGLLAPASGATGPDATSQPTASGAPNPPSTYWLYSSGGGVFPFGAAPDDGSEAGQTLTKPIVGMAGVPGRAGYWLVGSDGGIFSFGKASF